MARTFVDSSSNFAQYLGPVITTPPFTMACWAKTFGITTGQAHTLISVSKQTGTDRNVFALQLLDSNTSNSRVRAVTNNLVPPAVYADSTIDIPDNTIVHACAVFSSYDSRSAYSDGANKGTSTTSITPNGINELSIGRITNYGGTAVNYLNGIISEAAIWNVVLNDEEVNILAKGLSPIRMRPDNLIAYWPLVGEYSPEIDICGGFNLTLHGTTKSEHSRIIYPRRNRLYFPTFSSITISNISKQMQLNRLFI